MNTLLVRVRQLLRWFIHATDRYGLHLTVGGVGVVLLLAFLTPGVLQQVAKGQQSLAPHIVFVVGEELYDTDQTLPAFAERELTPKGFTTTFVYADSAAPNRFRGLKAALEKADLLVLSVRRRALPASQLASIRQYLAAGKPLVALRTSSHAFALRKNVPSEGHRQWENFDQTVLGGWYKGHYDNQEGTQVLTRPQAEDHPILNRLYHPTFQSKGTLYKSRRLTASTEVLLEGRALVDGKQVAEPVAWTNTYQEGRVFYTSLGHPSDFQQQPFRRLLTNAVYWGLEMKVPGMGEMAASTEVSEYMRRFEGRGALGGKDRYTPPTEAAQKFTVSNNLQIELVAAEPDIHQPVYVTFDSRGRLWVVQYNQYPYPEGVKVTGYDHHLRAAFDRLPAPPPRGARGADKITMLEDTTGDGVFDRSEDVITGLNIATSVTFGRGGVWVLAPPYLLKYPDTNGNGRPDGDPVIHLRGFGLQDTHSIANSLEWGPDGWLYGASGSTTIDTVSSAVTKKVAYQGQAIWRYHPETEVFEIFAEGGGNTFDVTFDAKGRLYSGHNGGSARAFHYKQGAYYQKNWGKHGALTNPYAFGYISHMPHTGDSKRFTHAEIVYEGKALPARYQGALISLNPLQRWVQASRLEPIGSTYKTVDTERMVTTPDRWFRPVDIVSGPDEAVYIADWYDDRLTHVDPRDTWHRSSGRVYRIRGNGKTVYDPVDLPRLSTDKLIDRLSSSNKWQRRQALRLIGDRKDRSAIPRLRQMVMENTGQLALEALWALNLSGGFNESWALKGLAHEDPFVRMWTVRLLGDRKNVSSGTAKSLKDLAQSETHPLVRSQLAASAKRLPASDALPIIRQLLGHEQDQEDQQIPLQIWWALEAQAEADREGVLEMFEEKKLWKEPLVKKYVLERLMQRYIMAGGSENLAAAAQFFQLAPSQEASQLLITGLQEGLRGSSQRLAEMPSALQQALQQYQQDIGRSNIALGLRQGDQEATDKVLSLIADPTAEKARRLEYIALLGEVDHPEAVPVLLEALGQSRSTAVRRMILHALVRYSDPKIGQRVAQLYPNRLRAEPEVRSAALELLVSRPAWALELLTAVDRKRIAPRDIPMQRVHRMQLFADDTIDKLLFKYWPDLDVDSANQLQQQTAAIVETLQSGTGDAGRGEQVFQKSCGTCHKLYGKGGDIGPDLTGYDRSNTEYMLLQTLTPSASIREGYVNYMVQTTDGRTLTGVITDRSGGAVTLKSLDGQQRLLPQHQVKEIRPLDRSIMPKGLLKRLSKQELRDLFAYLQGEDE